ncbi:unnamed protein product, partial [Mesorhabditis spiculigera]
MLKTLLFTIWAFATTAVALECVQCDRQGFDWHSDEENAHHAELCQLGQIRPTPCKNASHNSCIVSWFRSGMDQTRTVTQRKCGVPEDAKGCTLYNSKITRKVRHLISRDTSSRKREQQATFVEVCSEACAGGECLSSANRLASLFTILTITSLHAIQNDATSRQRLPSMSDSLGGYVGEPIEPFRCCRLRIRTGTFVIAYFELILIFTNILCKALGYLETAWNWELLFLVVDSITVLSLIYGTWRARAAFMQPFVVLNIMTISLLGLGTAFFITAAVDKHSYAGEYVEMELRDSSHHLAVFFGVDQSYVVRIVGGSTALIIGLTTIVHLWFFRVIVQCAQYFREVSKAAERSSIVFAEVSIAESDNTSTV